MILCLFTGAWWQWLLISLVILFIISCPIVFNIFGKEDPVGCETLSWWQRFLRNLKKN